MWRILTLLVIVSSFLHPFAIATDQLSPGPVLSGTINVIAANSAGIVVLTDSRLSYRVRNGSRRGSYKPLPNPAQKLFKIDDHTVCAFAGFASAPTPPLPDFLNNVSAIMGRYQRFLRQSHEATLRDKLQMLKVIFDYYLRGVANLREPASDGQDYSDYYVELFLAGYDADGTPHVGSLILGMRPDSSLDMGSLLVPFTIEEEVVSITDQQFFVHGQRSLAERILQHPGPWSRDHAVATYIRSLKDKRQLRLDELKSVAESLKRYTALKNSTVGGPSQIAVLTGGRLESLDELSFPPVAEAGFKFQIVQESGFEAGDISQAALPEGLGGGLVVERGLFTLYFKNEFKRVIQDLDEGYFNGNVFVGCRLLYFGGRLQFEDSNRVEDSELIISPGIDRQAPEVRHLLDHFHWKRVGVLGGSTAK
jgi:hypothetical protein